MKKLLILLVLLSTGCDRNLRITDKDTGKTYQLRACKDIEELVGFTLTEAKTGKKVEACIPVYVLIKE